MTRAATRNTTDAHLQRKTPEKLRASGLHSIKDSTIVFEQIKPPPHITAAMRESQSKSKPWCAATTPRDYAAPELAPYTGRPGAMDAFNQPSRVGSTLFFRDGHTEAVR